MVAMEILEDIANSQCGKSLKMKIPQRPENPVISMLFKVRYEEATQTKGHQLDCG